MSGHLSGDAPSGHIRRPNHRLAVHEPAADGWRRGGSLLCSDDLFGVRDWMLFHENGHRRLHKAVPRCRSAAPHRWKPTVSDLLSPDPPSILT